MLFERFDECRPAEHLPVKATEETLEICPVQSILDYVMSERVGGHSSEEADKILGTRKP